MKHLFIIVTSALLLIATTTAQALEYTPPADNETANKAIAEENSRLLRQLDSMIVNSAQLYEKKETRIELLKEHLSKTTDNMSKIETYSSLYDEYFVFQFDSAFTYIDKKIALATAIGNKQHYDMALLDKAALLSIGGLYSETAALLKEIDPEGLSEEVQIKYNVTHFYLYIYWSDYCHDKVYAPRYRQKATEYLRKTAALIRPDSKRYDFFMGEYYSNTDLNDDKAMSHYLRSMKNVRPDSREYAMASFAIASIFKGKGDMLRYEKYLIMACISDLRHSTRESQALQDLAMFLFRQGSSDNIDKAERYINFAMNDAKAYNNRLRILEISQKLPTIVASYREKLAAQNAVLAVATGGVTMLAVALIVLVNFIYRQNKQLTIRRHKLSQSNGELQRLNSEQQVLNNKLHTLNARLIDTNRRREHLAKIYIDLCANFIDRLGKFEMLVRRKIKANQIKDLLTMASSTKMTEEDASTFFNSFDKAFLDLYPTFVDEFNALLTPDEQTVKHKNGTHLTTEQRIFALIRLGVTESSEIAALLFYTPRTIYNYRSAVKAKAINRDTFEQDVAKLCTVI